MSLEKNERYEQIIEEIYNDYCEASKTTEVFHGDGTMTATSPASHYGFLSKERFMLKIMAEPEFAKKWGVTIYMHVEDIQHVWMGVHYKGETIEFPFKPAEKNSLQRDCAIIQKATNEIYSQYEADHSFRSIAFIHPMFYNGTFSENNEYQPEEPEPLLSQNDFMKKLTTDPDWKWSFAFGVLMSYISKNENE